MGFPSQRGKTEVWRGKALNPHHRARNCQGQIPTWLWSASRPLALNHYPPRKHVEMQRSVEEMVTSLESFPRRPICQRMSTNKSHNCASWSQYICLENSHHCDSYSPSLGQRPGATYSEAALRRQKVEVNSERSCFDREKKGLQGLSGEVRPPLWEKGLRRRKWGGSTALPCIPTTLGGKLKL